ncbi:MAG: type II secretion system F family protein [Pseudomonadota bacterium]
MPLEAVNIGAAALAALGLFGLQAMVFPALAYLWQRLPDTRRKKLSDVLEFVIGKPTDPVEAFALILFLALALGFGLFSAGATLPAILVILLLLGGIPAFLYTSGASKRSRELELALPLALQQVANEMAAGATLESALKRVADSAPAPADVEIARLQRRVEIMGVDEAFSEMARQLNLQSFTLTASVVRVGTSSGGRLIEALKNLSRTLIEIERLNKKLRTASENGRRNLYLMSIIGPLVAIGASLVVDHETSVLADPFGQVLIGVAALMFFAAHILGHRLTKVQV